MMLYTRHFIIEGKHLGAVTTKDALAHGQLSAPLSFTYLCPVCGDVWAKLPVESTTGSLSRWQALSASCRKHQAHSLAVPGSVLIGWLPDFDSNLPDEVVWWEFQRQMDNYNKGEAQ